MPSIRSSLASARKTWCSKLFATLWHNQSGELQNQCWEITKNHRQEPALTVSVTIMKSLMTVSQDRGQIWMVPLLLYQN